MKLHNFLSPNEEFNFYKLIIRLKERIKYDPQSIEEDSNIYKLLKSHAEELREIMWETQASNSLRNL